MNLMKDLSKYHFDKNIIQLLDKTHEVCKFYYGDHFIGWLRYDHMKETWEYIVPVMIKEYTLENILMCNEAIDLKCSHILSKNKRSLFTASEKLNSKVYKNILFPYFSKLIEDM